METRNKKEVDVVLTESRKKSLNHEDELKQKQIEKEQFVMQVEEKQRSQGIKVN